MYKTMAHSGRGVLSKAHHLCLIFPPTTEEMGHKTPDKGILEVIGECFLSVFSVHRLGLQMFLWLLGKGQHAQSESLKIEH